MGLLIIDEQKCKKDKVCVRTCPTAIIRLQAGEGFPEIPVDSEKSCIQCGQCVAVCPHGALSHKQVSIEDCPSIEKDLVINEQQAVQFLRSRRSIRRYQDKPVEKEKIQRLIEIARYAPTGSNTQMVEWLVLSDRSRIHQIAELTINWLREIIKENSQTPTTLNSPLIVSAWDAGYDVVLRNAPALVVASSPKEVGSGMVDLTLALGYLDLAAPTLGLGTCWAGLLQRALFSSPSLKETLGLPKDHPYHYPLMLGYPKTKYHRLPERLPPKITFV